MPSRSASNAAPSRHVPDRERQHRLELVELALGRVLAAQPRRPLEQADHRVERGVGVVGRAELAKRRVRLAARAARAGRGPGGTCRCRPRPRAGRTWPSPSFARSQRSSRSAELLLPADQRGEAAGRVPGLETALGRALAGDGEGAHRRREALERRGAQVAEGEQAAQEAARALGDDHGPGFGQGLQAGGEVGGLPDHRLLLRGTLADQVADHDQPGGDPDPGRQRLAAGCGQPRHRRRRREAGADGPLRLVLVRHGPAEVGQHAVAHELGHVPLEPGDLARPRRSGRPG